MRRIGISVLALLAPLGLLSMAERTVFASQDTALSSQDDGSDHSDEPQLKDGPRVVELKSMNDLKAALDLSRFAPILIYKHSTECPINARSAARLQSLLDVREKELPKMYMVKVIETRAVSNAIAETLQVEHESPQLILVKNRAALWDSDHEDITAENLDKALNEFLTAPGDEKKAEQ